MKDARDNFDKDKKLPQYGGKFGFQSAGSKDKNSKFSFQSAGSKDKMVEKVALKNGSAVQLEHIDNSEKSTSTS